MKIYMNCRDVPGLLYLFESEEFIYITKDKLQYCEEVK